MDWCRNLTLCWLVYRTVCCNDCSWNCRFNRILSIKIIQVKHSSGYINELCYISLAFGLMDAAEQVENGSCPDDGVIVRKADYQTNKRLKRRISKLKDSLLSFLRTHSYEVGQLVQKRNQKLFRAVVASQNHIQLDYFACWILLLRFQHHERDKPLDSKFNWICEKDSELMNIIDLLDMTPSSNSNSDMYEFATKIVREL